MIPLYSTEMMICDLTWTHSDLFMISDVAREASDRAEHILN